MERAARQRFLGDYAAIRHAEGRGSEDPEYYRALPYRDLTGKNAVQWQMRGRSFRAFETTILDDLVREKGKPLRILDLGAGTGWFTWRMGEKGHRAVAVDIFDDSRDGLGARQHFPVPPPAVVAEFDALPFGDGSFDVAVFNSSLHYSADYARTLREAKRVLESDGAVVVVDSPIYRQRAHGELMREERQTFFEQKYGFRSDALGSVEYLDEETLRALSREVGINWNYAGVWYGWRWALRPLRAALRGARPPSRFAILTGRFAT